MSHIENPWWEEKKYPDETWTIEHRNDGFWVRIGDGEWKKADIAYGIDIEKTIKDKEEKNEDMKEQWKFIRSGGKWDKTLLSTDDLIMLRDHINQIIFERANEQTNKRVL